MYDLHNAFSRMSLSLSSPEWPRVAGEFEGMPSSSSAATSFRAQSNNTDRRPVPALLVMDGSHLQEAFMRTVGVVGDDNDRRDLVAGLLDEMERAFSVRFIKKVLHEATLGGKPTALATALSCLSSSHNSPVVTKTRPLKVKAGAPIDPDTLEPINGEGDGGALTMLVEAGVDVAMSLDVLRHASLGDQRSFRTIVVVTGNGDLAEVLDLASSSGAQVHVCGIRGAVAPALQHLLHRNFNYLDDLLSSAVDLLAARARHNPISGEKLKKMCEMGSQCTIMDDAEHRKSHVHPCAKGGACELLRRRPIGSSGNQEEEDEEDDVSANGRLEHLMHFTHPCARAGKCDKKRQDHHLLMWSHPLTAEAEQKHPVSPRVDGLWRSSEDSHHHRGGEEDMLGGEDPAVNSNSYDDLLLAGRPPADQRPQPWGGLGADSMMSQQHQSLRQDTRLTASHFNRTSHHSQQDGDDDNMYMDSRWGGRAMTKRKKRVLPQGLLNPLMMMGAKDDEGMGDDFGDDEESQEMMEVFRFAFRGLAQQQHRETKDDGYGFYASGDASDQEEEEFTGEEEEEDKAAAFGEDGRGGDPACMFSMSL